MKNKFIKRKGLLMAGLLSASLLMVPGKAVASDQETKIHFISLASTTDAILLESNGHYGVVDSGEDWEYPDGTDARYPLREGITRGIGYEQQVIHYLKSQGVEKLDFYIAILLRILTVTTLAVGMRFWMHFQRTDFILTDMMIPTL